jgi:hypothetical protein
MKFLKAENQGSELKILHTEAGVIVLKRIIVSTEGQRKLYRCSVMLRRRIVKLNILFRTESQGEVRSSVSVCAMNSHSHVIMFQSGTALCIVILL